MEKIRTLDELEGTLGSVIDELSETADAVLVERRGAPEAAIISLDEYRRLREVDDRQRRQEAFDRMERLRLEIKERTSDLDDEARTALVEELSHETMNRIIANATFRFVE